MSKDNEKQRTFTRRAVVFGGLQMTAFTALAGRLFYLQFIKSGEFSTLSENNSIKLQLIPPDRGHILDRYNVPLAANQKNYRLFFDFAGQNTATFQSTLSKLHDLITLPEKKWQELKTTRVSSASMPVLLKEHLTWDEVSLIELKTLDLPGISIDAGQLRFYPLADKAAHLLGYVGTVSEEESAHENEPLLRLPEFKIGKSGVEKMMESKLRGIAGIHQLEVNVRGVPVREVSHKESIPGENVKLTIDSTLQEYASTLITGQSASVIVMEVDTGNVLALVAMPAFDPSIFSVGISSDYWKTLSNDKKSPLLNKSIAGQYPPGSTFKPMIGLAALETGTITSDTTVFCPGHFMLGDHSFSCWKVGGHGTMNFHHAIEQSCDVFFYTIAQRLGIQPYSDMAKRFGLGQMPGIGMPGEKAAVIPDPDWKMKTYKQKWTAGDTINCSIGQGYVLATPLQLGVMMARIASGRNVKPRLFIPPGQENPKFDPVAIDGDILQQLHDAMSAVVNDPGGTAYGKRITEPRFAMAGKTGTSQVRHLIREGMNQNLLPWEYRHHALFIGFAPVDKPKYACAVAIEHGGAGAGAAAPVARDVLLKVQQMAEQKSNHPA